MKSKKVYLGDCVYAELNSKESNIIYLYPGGV
jgi:hypothetical protein